MPWLGAEIDRVNPRLLVTLGATAGQALFGSSFRVGAHRGEQLTWQPGPDAGAQAETELTVVPTIHPSAVLRADDRGAVYAGCSLTSAPEPTSSRRSVRRITIWPAQVRPALAQGTRRPTKAQSDRQP